MGVTMSRDGKARGQIEIPVIVGVPNINPGLALCQMIGKVSAKKVTLRFSYLLSSLVSSLDFGPGIGVQTCGSIGTRQYLAGITNYR